MQSHQKVFYHPHLPIIKGSREARIPSLHPTSPHSFPPSVKEFQISTHASLELDKANKDRKDTHKEESPHHLSLQNLTIRPLPPLRRDPSTHKIPILPYPFPQPNTIHLSHLPIAPPPLSSPYFPLIT